MWSLINKIIFKFLFSTLIISGFLLVPFVKIHAASLSLSLSTETVSVGNIISLKVLLNTNSKYVNNTEATVQFPTDMLEVVSVTKASSIFTLWVEEPSFSNYTGKVVFNGGVPTPGFNGPSGYIATITFKAKREGLASVILTDATVRENDGLGTDILNFKSGSVITIGIPKVIEIPITNDSNPTLNTLKSLAPSKPIIVSLTHPDQDFWYSNNTATFSWKIPNEVNRIQTLYSKDINANPTINYDNTVTEKTLNNLNDGIYYFHLRYYNSTGKSPVASYKVKIDTTPPLNFNPTIRKDGSNNFIKLNTTDATSGVNYYNLNIDNKQVIKVGLDEIINNEYKLPVQNGGNHDVLVTVYDKANNSVVVNNTSYTSLPITVPVLKVDPKEIITGKSTTIT